MGEAEKGRDSEGGEGKDVGFKVAWLKHVLSVHVLFPLTVSGWKGALKMVR